MARVYHAQTVQTLDDCVALYATFSSSSSSSSSSSLQFQEPIKEKE